MRTRRPSSRRSLLVAGCAWMLILAGVGAASGSVAPWIRSYDGDLATQQLRTAYLTRDGSDVFMLAKTGPQLTMAAPVTNTDGNTREAIWPTGSIRSRNAQTCATWLRESNDFVQEGLALRIRHSGSTTTAITVTKNIYGGAHWVFNVHAWDSSSDSPFTQLGAWDLSPVILDQDGHYQPMPWRVCFRAVGDVVSMKIWWPQQMSEPSWNDPDYTRSLTLPAGYSRSGHAGWYVGHLQPGMSTAYDGLGTWFALALPSLG